MKLLCRIRQVGRHLPKLFDSLARLKFEDEEDVDFRQNSDASSSDMEVKVAVGMRSRDGEYVALSEPCDCSGQVHCSDQVSG